MSHICPLVDGKGIADTCCCWMADTSNNKTTCSIGNIIITLLQQGKNEKLYYHLWSSTITTHENTTNDVRKNTQYFLLHSKHSLGLTDQKHYILTADLASQFEQCLLILWCATFTVCQWLASDQNQTRTPGSLKPKLHDQSFNDITIYGFPWQLIVHHHMTWSKVYYNCLATCPKVCADKVTCIAARPQNT